MKKIAKITLLVIMIALSLAVMALPAFAAGDAAEGSGEIVDNAEIMPGTTGGIDISVDFSRFVDSLQYMWKGMLCIFIVIGVIILITWTLNKAINAIAEAKAAKDNEEN